jgi:ribosomal protein S18 acetylase RimI-like enzyme
LAYLSEAIIYDDYEIQPLKQTREEIRNEIDTRVVLKSTEGGRIIGSVRAYQRGETCFIGKLIVHPERQNQGIGSSLMAAVEKMFPTARRFELFTGHKSVRNLHLYGKLGYREFGREVVNHKLVHVFMEKRY